MAKIETFTEDFASGIDTATKWTKSTNVTSSGGQAVLPIETSINSLYSQASYDLTSSFLLFQYAALPGSGSTDQNNLRISDTQLGTSNVLRFFWQGSDGTIKCYKDATELASMTWNASTHSWCKISESGGTVTFAYSSDGLSWTTFVTTSTPAWGSGVTAVYPRWSTFRGAGTTRNATLDNVNLPPSPASTFVPQIVII